MCTHTGQVEHQRYSRAGRVQKNHKILNKNTIFNEQPVEKSNRPEGRETTAFFTEGHQTVMGAGHIECFLFLMGQRYNYGFIYQEMTNDNLSFVLGQYSHSFIHLFIPMKDLLSTWREILSLDRSYIFPLSCTHPPTKDERT